MGHNGRQTRKGRRLKGKKNLDSTLVFNDSPAQIPLYRKKREQSDRLLAFKQKLSLMNYNPPTKSFLFMPAFTWVLVFMGRLLSWWPVAFEVRVMMLQERGLTLE